MRVAINALLLSGRYSGVERAILALLRHIGEEAEGDEFVALVGNDFDERELEGCGVQVRRLPVTNRSRLVRILYEEWGLPRRLKGFDLFHAPGYVAPRLPIPTVLTVYDLVALRHPRLARRTNAIHYRWRLPRAASRAARILVPTESVAADVVEFLGVERQRVRVVPLGVEAHFRPPSREQRASARTRYHLDRPFLLFVGNLEPKKNLSTLIRAFARLRAGGLPHELVIAGKRGWRCRDVLRLPARLGLADSVRLIGYVAESDLPALYGASELFVFPSLVEGFGLPPLEAMACGVPVVTSDAPALVETTGEAAVHVPARDAEGLAEAIRALLADPERRGTLREAGLAHAAGFTWAAAAAATRAVYREVCS
ncbi:MAG: glycosyltransferase family 4 protein [bacterium]